MIEGLHAANYCAYGSRRMWKALLREGEQVGRSRVERLMRQNGIQGAKRRGKPWRTTKADPVALRSPDRVQRDFTASRPDEKWFADFTYLRCWEGPVFFSFVIDAYSRMIVGWQFAGHMRTDLVLDALRMALHQRATGADVSLVAHSDAGSQYTSYDYTQLLDDHDVLASIGTVGDAYDNAAAESFVDTFKTELITDRTWASRSQLELAIVRYVAWFNNTRLHNLSTTGHPERSRNYTLRKTGRPHPHTERREPTKTISVEPRAAQSEAAGDWARLPAALGSFQVREGWGTRAAVGHLLGKPGEPCGVLSFLAKVVASNEPRGAVACSGGLDVGGLLAGLPSAGEHDGALDCRGVDVLRVGQSQRLQVIASELDRGAAPNRRHIKRRAMLAVLVFPGPRCRGVGDDRPEGRPTSELRTAARDSVTRPARFELATSRSGGVGGRETISGVSPLER